MDILELKLNTHCLPALHTFYGERLGFPVLEADQQVLVLRAGATRLSFAQAIATVPMHYHFAFNIPSNQFAEAKRWLAERVELVKINDRDEIHWSAWNAHAVYFLDPAGNIVELIARHNLAEEAGLPFSPANISRVSEIGLAVDDVPLAASALQTALGIGVWDGGDGSVFTALGDEHGLFIVVKQGRAWFPTQDRLADFYPLELTMTGKHPLTYRPDGLPYLFNVVN